MPRSVRTVIGDKNQVSGPLLQPGEEAPEGGHIQVKAGHLRPIQSKDKLVLAKDRPGHESQKVAFLCLFGKGNITYPGKHKIQNTGTKQNEVPSRCAALEMCFLNQLVKFSN